MRRAAIILAFLACAGPIAAPAQTRPASMSADDAYVRAVAYIETRFNALRVEQAASDAVAAAEAARLRGELASARKELAALKARADAPSRTIIDAFAAGDPSAGLEAAEAEARKASSDAGARWLQIAALAAPFEPQRAIAAYREALRLKPDDSARLALAALLTRVGDAGSAVQIAQDVAKTADLALRAKALIAWGDAARGSTGELKAKALYTEAADAARTAKDRATELDALTRLAAAAIRAGDPPVWEGRLKEALAAAAALDDRIRGADAAVALAEAYLQRGIWPPAATYAAEALEIYQASNDPIGQATATMALGRAAMARPSPGLAEMHFRSALRLYEAAQAKLGQADALAELGAAVSKQNRAPEACLTWRRASGLYASAGAFSAPQAETVRTALQTCR